MERSPKEPKIVGFGSYRGGPGKTFAAYNIGVCLAAANQRVLLVDWDLAKPDLTTLASVYEGNEGRQPTSQVAPLFTTYLAEGDWQAHLSPNKAFNWKLPRQLDGITETGKLLLLPADVDEAVNPLRQRESRALLRGFEEKFASPAAMREFAQGFRTATQALYDYVLIDCPGGDNWQADLVLGYIADVSLVASIPNTMDLGGTLQLISKIRALPNPLTRRHFIPVISRGDTNWASVPSYAQPITESAMAMAAQIPDSGDRGQWLSSPMVIADDKYSNLGFGEPSVAVLLNELGGVTYSGESYMQLFEEIGKLFRDRFSGQRIKNHLMGDKTRSFTLEGKYAEAEKLLRSWNPSTGQAIDMVDCLSGVYQSTGALDKDAKNLLEGLRGKLDDGAIRGSSPSPRQQAYLTARTIGEAIWEQRVQQWKEADRKLRENFDNR